MVGSKKWERYTVYDDGGAEVGWVILKDNNQGRLGRVYIHIDNTIGHATLVKQFDDNNEAIKWLKEALNVA